MDEDGYLATFNYLTGETITITKADGSVASIIGVGVATVTGANFRSGILAFNQTNAGWRLWSWRGQVVPFLTRAGVTSQLNTIDSGLTECPQDAPAAALTPDGKFLAFAWMERRDVERDADVFWTYGTPGKLRPDTCCHDDRRYQQRRPTLAIDPDGTVWCAWEDGRLSTQRVFFASTRDPANIPLGDAKEGGGSAPSLASGGGKVGIAYQSGDNVAFRQLTPK
jgi:hypothetical protein